MFKLKDLPKYSKTLKIRNIERFERYRPVLSKIEEDDESERKGRGNDGVKVEKERDKNVEWTKTPIYK